MFPTRLSLLKLPWNVVLSKWENGLIGKQILPGSGDSFLGSITTRRNRTITIALALHRRKRCHPQYQLYHWHGGILPAQTSVIAQDWVKGRGERSLRP